MRVPKSLAIAVLVVAAQLSVVSAELAVLRNGFSIKHERHEEIGATIRLYTAEGYVDVQTASIASFEPDDTPVPAPAPGKEPVPVPAAQTAQSAPLDLEQIVRDAAGKRQIDPDFINSVIKAESNFHPRAVSPKGAQGLMQLMPGTAAKLGVKDAFDPTANVNAGTAHLSELLELYHNDPIKALAAYNAGAHRVEQYHGVPPYRETRAYIARIVRDFNAKKLAQMKATQSSPATPPQNSNTGKNAKGKAAKPKTSRQASLVASQSTPQAE